MDSKKCQSVFSPALARRLIQQGFIIKDIKPDKENRDKSIFIFDATEEFCEAFDKLKAEKLEAKISTSELSAHGIELGVM